MNKKIDKKTGDNQEVVSSLLETEFKIPEGKIGERVDSYLSSELGLSRSFIQKMIKGGNVTSNQTSKLKPSKKLKVDEILNVQVPEPEMIDLIPEPVDFDVIHEDKDIIVVDKPAGVVVHPAPGHWRGTLVHGLLHRYPEIGNINNIIRPGIVHRLDSTTSGIMIIARNSKAMTKLQELFKDRHVHKEYLALAEGRPLTPKLRVNVPIGRDVKNRYRMAVTPDGKDSITDFSLLWSRGPFSFVRCLLHTGRTHQIRVHMRYCGAPLVGDELYGFKGGHKDLLKGRVFLHSWKLEIPHPITGVKLSFISHLPSELIQVLREVIAKYQG